MRQRTIKQLSRASIPEQRDCVVTLVAVNFPEIDRSTGETSRMICTGESMEIVRRSPNSWSDTSCHQNLVRYQISERSLVDRKECRSRFPARGLSVSVIDSFL
jgi:hypothetical protein